MRRQNIFHTEFSANFSSEKNQKILEGVYVPNQTINQNSAETNVNEFIRTRGNLDQEIDVKAMSELVKIYGRPSLKYESFIQPNRSKVYGSNGEELTAKQI